MRAGMRSGSGEDAFDDLLPPLHSIFALLTRTAHVAETLSGRHAESQAHIDSLLHNIESTRLFYEKQQQQP